MKLGIIGATGWLGGALGARLIQGGLWRAEDMVLANRSGPAGYDGLGVIWADVAGLCAVSDVIVMAARPEDFPMPGFGAGGKLVISFATVWTLAKLRALAPQARLVRAMPNGAAAEGKAIRPGCRMGFRRRMPGWWRAFCRPWGRWRGWKARHSLTTWPPCRGLAWPIRR